MKLIANAVCFQMVWLATVAGAANGLWWAGPLALLLFAAWQLPLSDHRRADLRLMLVAAAAGFLIDSMLVLSGLVRFQTAVPWESVAPIWIVTLWVAFALTLNHSMGGLKRYPRLAIAFGLIGGPLAYWIADVVWHAISFDGRLFVALAAIGLVWAVATPLLLSLAERLRLQKAA